MTSSKWASLSNSAGIVADAAEVIVDFAVLDAGAGRGSAMDGGGQVVKVEALVKLNADSDIDAGGDSEGIVGATFEVDEGADDDVGFAGAIEHAGTVADSAARFLNAGIFARYAGAGTAAAVVFAGVNGELVDGILNAGDFAGYAGTRTAAAVAFAGVKVGFANVE